MLIKKKNLLLLPNEIKVLIFNNFSYYYIKCVLNVCNELNNNIYECLTNEDIGEYLGKLINGKIFGSTLLKIKFEIGIFVPFFLFW